MLLSLRGVNGGLYYILYTGITALQIFVNIYDKWNLLMYANN